MQKRPQWRNGENVFPEFEIVEDAAWLWDERGMGRAENVKVSCDMKAVEIIWIFILKKLLKVLKFLCDFEKVFLFCCIYDWKQKFSKNR